MGGNEAEAVSGSLSGCWGCGHCVYVSWLVLSSKNAFFEVGLHMVDCMLMKVKRKEKGMKEPGWKDGANAL